LSETTKVRIAKAEEQQKYLRQFRKDLFASVFGISIH
jgi:hypothetical protein